MTMVLGLLIRGYAFQVSDRLVTQAGGGAVRPFDPLANKTVIFRARDGILAIGYSDRAYLDGVPTDVWIAQSLAAREFSTQFGMGAVDVSPSQWRHSGPTITRLRADAEAAIGRLTEQERNSHLQRFQIIGIKLAKRTPKVRPLLCTIEEPSYGSALSLAHYGRHLAWDRQYLLMATPDMAAEELARLRSELKARANEGPDTCEAILAASIRRIADEDPTVGKDLMAVQIKSRDPHVQIRYLPFTSEASPSHEGLPLAYTPWIIAPPSVHGPALSNGGWTTRHLSWSVVGLPTQEGPARAMQKLSSSSLSVNPSEIRRAGHRARATNLAATRGGLP